MTSQLFLFADDRLSTIEMPAARPLRWAAWHGDRCLLAGNGGTALWFYPSTSLRAGSRRFEALDTGTKQNLRGAAFSPNGREALLVGNRGLVLHCDGNSVRRVASPTSENLRRVAWRPGGDEALIVGNAGTVLRYDGGSLTPVPGDRAHTLRTVAWRPDGAYALIGAYASQYAGYPRPHALYKCDNLYLQALLTSDDIDDFVAVDWHPSGAHALIAGYAYGERVSNKLLTYDGSGFATHAVEASGALLGAAWHPDGSYALLCGENGALLRYAPSTSLRAGSGRVEQITSGTKDNLVGPFWKPDGSSALLLRGPSERVYTV
jgi:hypothetical protein